MRKQTTGVLVIGGFVAVALLAVHAPGGPGMGWPDMSAAAQAAATELTFDVAIENGKVAEDAELIRVTQGDAVVLRWTSDAPIEVHLHGYDIEMDVEPGAETTMAFTAEFAGRFPVEAHLGSGEATLLYLEVLPH